jgi:hypothetical protein
MLTFNRVGSWLLLLAGVVLVGAAVPSTVGAAGFS